MADRTITPAVRAVVLQWLNARAHTLDLVLEEVAEEIAPLVASQALECLQGLIFENSSREVMLQLVKACRHALQHLLTLHTGEYKDAQIMAEGLTDILAAAIEAAEQLGCHDLLIDKSNNVAEKTPFDDLEGGEE